MRVFIYNRQNIWESELTGGFIGLGHNVKHGYPETPESFAATLQDFKPHLLMTLGAPNQYDTSTLEYIGSMAQKRNYIYIHWDTEGFDRGFSERFIKTSRPDILLTISPLVQKMTTAKGWLTYILPYGINSQIHHPINHITSHNKIFSLIASNYARVTDARRYDHRYASYTALLDPLLEHNIPVQVRGHGWYKETERIAKGLQVFPYCNYLETNNIYNSAYINLVFQSSNDRITKRTFEILGAGGFILSYDSLELRKHFKNGKELLISSSPQETIEIINYYNAHPNEYWTIRENAIKRASEFTYTKRLKQVFDEIQRDGKITLPK